MEIHSCSRFVAPRRAFARLVLCLGFAFAGVMALVAAEEAGKRSYDIPAGNAADALKQFSEQSGRGVMANGDLVKGIRTNAVKGEHAPVDALELLLADTGLVAIPDTKSGAFSIRKETAIEAKNVNRAIVEKSGRPDRSGRTELEEKGEPVVKLDTFEVFGRKTLNMDIRRTRDDPQPYVVFDNTVLVNSGATNLEDFLKTRLSMNAQQEFSAQSLDINLLTSPAGSSSEINLRGMGSAQTLVLVDGRRLPSINSGITRMFAQPNINGIPMRAIERIEILPATASGIYGGGATGGVINIVLRRNYTEKEFALLYGDTFDGASARKQSGVNFGFNLNDGKTRLMLSASYRDVNPLLVGNRDFGIRARQALATNNPAAIFGTIQNPIVFSGYTTNIRSETLVAGVRQSLVLDNGVQLRSNVTSVPVGYAGIETDGGAALAARAGFMNIDLADDASSATGRRRYLINGITSEDLNLSARHEVNKNMEIYLDAVRSKIAQFAPWPSGSSFVLAADSPANPFQQDIRVTVPLPDKDDQVIQNESEQRRVMLGLVVRLPHRWTTLLDLTFARSFSGIEYNNSDFALTADGIAALQDGRLAVLRDVNLFPVDFESYMIPQRSSEGGPFVTDLRHAVLRAGGPIVTTKSFEAHVSAAMERRNEEAKGGYRSLVQGLDILTDYIPSRKQLVDSGYAELSFSSSPRILPGSFDGQLAVRHDRYITEAPFPLSVRLADRGSTLPDVSYVANKRAKTVYSAAFSWKLSEDLMLRASNSTGFLPPNTHLIVPIVVPTSAATVPIIYSGLTDPRRGNTPILTDANGVVQPFERVAGGNPNLRPEKSESQSFGVVVNPSSLKGLRFSIDYVRTRKRDEIQSSLALNSLADFEANYPDRVVRGANLGSDPASWAGPILRIDQSAVNVATTEVEAFDFQLDYRFKTARSVATIYLMATYQPRLALQLIEGGDTLNYVGYSQGAAGSYNTLPWKGNVGADLRIANFFVGWNMQYYDDYFAFSVTNSPAVRASRILSQGAAKIPSQRYHDIYIKWQSGFRKAWLFRNTDLTLSVQNVFNKYPPLVANTLIPGGYSTYGDPRLRRFELSLTKQL